MTANDAITVEPNMVEREIPGYFNHAAQEHMPARTVSDRHGFIARWPEKGLQGWSMSKEAAVAMVEKMAARKEAPSV